MSTLALDEALRRAVRDIPDFPKPGIMFKDITPALADAALFRAMTDAMAAPFADAGITHVVGIEARGFILAAPIAQRLGAGFVPVRKPGKLPHRVQRVEYALEYGSDVLEMHEDGVGVESVVLVADDVLATGGTASATCRLVEATGARVAGCAFLIELGFLNGARVLGARTVRSVLRY